jgi:hypothetical protein
MRIDVPVSPNPIALDDYLRAKEELPNIARSLVEGGGEKSNASSSLDPSRRTCNLNGEDVISLESSQTGGLARGM